jgi:hypothetical protein
MFSWPDRRRTGPRAVVLSAAALLLAAAPIPTAGAATTPTPAAGQTPGVATDPFRINFTVFYQEAGTQHVIEKNLPTGSTDLGGTITSGVGALTVQPTDGYRYVFARATTGAVYMRQARTAGATWFPWRQVGGRITGTPSASCLGPGLRPPIVWVRAANDHLYRRVLAGGAGWQNLGGQLTSDPTAIPAAMGACPDVEDAFMLGQNGTILEWSRGFHTVGGTANAAPAPLRFPDGRTWLFIRGTTDNALWLKTRPAHSTTWSAWRKLGGILDSAPAAALFRDQANVIARAPNDSLYQGQFVNGTWTWRRIP